MSPPRSTSRALTRARSVQLADIDVIEDAAGPGRRLVLWLQGCDRRCPGCANEAFLPRRGGRAVSVEELAAFAARLPNLDGLTLTGGEPVLQAAALVPLLAAAHRLGLTVMCYTGYTLGELTAGQTVPSLPEFLAHIDLLVDGRYRPELPPAGPYRASANQQLHFLSDRISPASCAQTAGTVVMIGGSDATVTGTLPASVCEALFARLRAYGIVLEQEAPPIRRKTR